MKVSHILKCEFGLNFDRFHRHPRITFRNEFKLENEQLKFLIENFNDKMD